MHLDEFVKFAYTVEGKFKIWYVFEPFNKFVSNFLIYETTK